MLGVDLGDVSQNVSRMYISIYRRAGCVSYTDTDVV
jgi:hypothetical protein